MTPTEAPVTVMTWNLHAEPVARVGLREAISRWDPDVIVLQEADLVREADAELLPPYMTLERFPDAATPPGMALATRLPVLEWGILDEPRDAWDRQRAFWMTLDAGGRPLTVVGVHLSVPFPADSLPCPYCPTLRDAQVRAVADFARQRKAAGESVLIAGDFNLTEREVAYRDLAGLTDAARGLTWRPLAVRYLPPLLRLDYVMVGEGIGVASSEVDCSISRSDHCPVVVRLALP